MGRRMIPGGYRCARAERRRALRTLSALAFVARAAMAASAHAGSPLSAADLDRLPLEDLAKIEISSVSKTAQPLSDAPAAIFVITHEDIMRSGAASLADMLRLAPNLQVAQVTGNSYAISARGFNGTAADKLLVLIDGRSVYTPFTNGVFWEAQDVPAEDIERIEVISGPGATLWGANAVNGVINVITRKSSDTPGGVVELTGGNLHRSVTLQYGGQIARDLSFRVYADDTDHDQDVTSTGANAKDDLQRWQTGFRIDWAPAADLVTLQGDLYEESRGEAPPLVREADSGGNLLARWTHKIDGGGEVQTQAYYDHLERRAPGEADESQDTYDLDFQHSFALGQRHAIVWGAGYRITRDDFSIVPGNPSSPFVQVFKPQRRTLNQGDLFAQDTITLRPTLKLTLGLKLEDDPYSGAEPLPNARLSWKVTDQTLLWAAVSRAVRAPSRLDRDFNELAGGRLFLTGGLFRSETLIAYEVGYRGQPTSRASVSVSAFYNVYDDLRTFELSPGGQLPLRIENQMEGETYGVEAWGSYQAADWWRLTAGANWLHKDLRFKPGSIALGGVQIAGDDPAYQVSLRSMMNLGRRVILDLDLRDVGALPSPASPTYVELGGRLAWSATNALELSVTGANLLQPHHPEFGSGASSVQLGATGVDTGRSVYVAARWRY
jgi:iron complex outermembrane receptor protein